MIKNIQNIYENLLELSDLNLQKEIWLNIENTKGLISSYAELMNRLFDDDSFDLFIDKRALELGIGSNIIAQLNHLRSFLNHYNEKTTDAEIINDQNWIHISNNGSLIIEIWNNDIESKRYLPKSPE